MTARVLTVAGTRPEAIKLAPILLRLRDDADIDDRLVVTGQHREILGQALGAFGLEAESDLTILEPGQGLASLTARALDGLGPLLERLAPDLLVVQGDTTTAFAAALAAFYAGIPVAHVEAGLRTGDNETPFPEEVNRRLITALGNLHLAPTPWAKANLIAERVPERSIVVTGNTVVDAVQIYLSRHGTSLSTEDLAAAVDTTSGRPLVVVTSHRRENWGQPQRAIARAVAKAARSIPDARFLVVLHPNPVVRRAFVPTLGRLPNVVLSEPLEYGEMLRVLQHASLALTDSGGIQEEGTALGVPVLVLRDVTERPEGVLAGVVRLVGTDESSIYRTMIQLLRVPGLRTTMAHASTVFGDGRAAERSHAAIRARLGLEAPDMDEFSPPEIGALRQMDDDALEVVT